MQQQIFDTLSGSKRPLRPQRPGHVGIYVCGPTVYDEPHVGHGRVYVFFDVAVRFLRRQAEVTYVRNLTDIDDKIIARAAAGGETAAAVSARFIAAFQRTMAALGCLPPDHEPQVTQYVPQVVALVAKLIASGHAYAAAGDVYYAVERFATYGRLGRRSLADTAAGARVEVVAHKRHPMDFVLWKAAKPGEPAWPSPWGPGRPGWHIECSAMAGALLGATLDIHGGGRDLIFPHHENEIAQSEAAGSAPLAQVWMHNGLVNIDQVKMSKSLGNFTTVAELLQRWHAQTLRLYLLSTHYRAPLQFTAEGLREAEQRVKYCYETLQRLQRALAALSASTAAAAGRAGPYRAATVASLRQRFDAAMADDFHTPQALGELSEAFRVVNEIVASPGEAGADARTLQAIAAALRHAGEVLGLFDAPPAAVLAALGQARSAARQLDVAAVEALIEVRAAARRERDFARADAARAQLEALGVTLSDGPGGTTWEAL